MHTPSRHSVHKAPAMGFGCFLVTNSMLLYIVALMFSRDVVLFFNLALVVGLATGLLCAGVFLIKKSNQAYPVFNAVLGTMISLVLLLMFIMLFFAANLF